MSHVGGIKAEPPPDLRLPTGDIAVEISIINTTTDIVCPSGSFVKPILKGHEFLNLPTFSFHIRHPSGKQVLFDLGARKDYWNLSPAVFDNLKRVCPAVAVRRGVHEILTEEGVDVNKIVALIWSHWHWDHIGDPSLFPKGADLLVGPGFKSAPELMSGYPTNPDARTLESDFEGRNVIEVPFSDELKIGQFQAYDYFEDRSFYILNVPGHATGHISALARTTNDTFVFLGGDVCHFGGSYRPTQYSPMPATITDGTPLDNIRFELPCPCSVFTACHPRKGRERTSPYYEVTQQEGSWYIDPPVAQRSIITLAEFDAHPDVLVCIAHDEALLPVLDWFPNGTLNEWKSKGWKERAQWGFLNALPTGGKAARGPLAPGLVRDGERIREWEQFDGPLWKVYQSSQPA